MPVLPPSPAAENGAPRLDVWLLIYFVPFCVLMLGIAFYLAQRLHEMNGVGAAESMERGGLEGDNDDAAIADFTEAIRLGPKPNASNAYLDRGTDYDHKGDRVRAMADYNESLRLDPNNPGARQYRGSAFFEAGNYDQAIADLNEAVRLAPNNGPAYLTLALAKQAKGDYEGAAEDYRLTIEATGAPITYARIYLTLVLRRLHRDETAAGLEAFIASWKTEWKDTWFKSVALYLTHRMPEAEFLVEAEKGEQATAREHQCDALYYAGMTHLADGDEPGAKQFFTQCRATNGQQETEYGLAGLELAHLPAAK